MKLLNRIASITLAFALVISAFAVLPALKAEAKGGVAIGGVLIQGGDVVVAASGTAASDDGMYHLVASDVNQAAPAGTDVAQATVSASATFSVPLAKDTANSMLFKKFTVCVMSGGALSPVSNSM